jgi:hypothetical protein
LKTYFETVGKEIGAQQATFRDVAAAHAKAWRDAADKFHASAEQLAAAQRARADAPIANLRSEAAKAEAHLQTLKQAGGESWAALSKALSQSRKPFEEANQKTWDALKRATAKKG